MIIIRISALLVPDRIKRVTNQLYALLSFISPVTNPREGGHAVQYIDYRSNEGGDGF